MAVTPSQLELDKKQAEYAAESASSAKELESTLKRIETVNGRLNNTQKESLDIAKGLSKAYKDISDSISLRQQSEVKEESYIQKLQKQLGKINKDRRESVDYVKKLNNNLRDQESILYQQTRILDTRQKITIDLEEQLKHANDAQRSGIIDQLQISRKREAAIQKQVDLSKNLVESYKTQIPLAERLSKSLLRESLLLQKTLREEVWKSLLKGIETIFSKFFGLELTLAGISTLLFNADKSTTKLANNLGLSREAAQGIRNEYSQFVRFSEDAGLTTEKMLEAQIELSKELGIAVKFSNEELQIFNRLTKVMGVSSGAAAKLNLIAKASGTEYKNIQSNILKGAIAAKEQLDVAVDNRDIFEEIGKLSAGILIKFQSNPEALGAAVIQAKKLGLSLEQVDKVGESLLNWESSIENELKAELLTNRNINLERARAAALTGSQADLMAEIAAQAGSLADYQELNVLAQGALAGAFGLSRDEMSEMLMKQELINQYGDEAAKLNKQQAEEFKKSGLSLDDYLAKQGAQVALQEQFNNSIEKLKELVVTLVQGPFGTLLNLIISMSDVLATIAITFGTIWTLSKAIALWKSISLGYDYAGLTAAGTRLTLQEATTAAAGAELAERVGIASAYAVANPIAAIGGLVIAGSVIAGLTSLLKSRPKLAEGGIVLPQSGGVDITVAEAGQAEAIVPLNSPTGRSMLGINPVNGTALTANAASSDSPLLNKIESLQNDNKQLLSTIKQIMLNPVAPTIILDNERMNTLSQAQLRTSRPVLI